jgi:hypothetical protein
MADILSISIGGTLKIANVPLFSKSDLSLTAAENRKEEVLLTNETYTVDITKYNAINALCIEAYYAVNSTTPTIVTQGDPAPFTLALSGGSAVSCKGIFMILLNTAPTGIVIDSTVDTRQIQYKISFITSA